MTHELTEALQYCVVLLGPERRTRFPDFAAEFTGRACDLGLDINRHTTLATELTAVPDDRESLVTVVWCGSTEKSTKPEIEELAQLLDDGVSVFPAVESLVDYTEKVPDLLKPLNGIEWQNCHALVSGVLQSFGLLRQGKRVFVSYRRKESQAVAHQLFERLQTRGYRAFLDTASIDVGLNVQDDLKSQLADMDVVVLLHTRAALKSTWVMEEVLDAQRRGTEVFDLLWPDATPARELSLAISERLAESDFENPEAPDPSNHRLTEAFLEEFIARVERARIRSVRTRRDRLLRQMAEDADLAKTSFRYYVTGHRDITSVPFAGYAPQNSADVTCMAIVSHGTPDAVELHRGEQAAQCQDGTQRPAKIVYDELGLHDEQLQHLDWLNKLADSIGVRFLRLGQHYQWLKSGGANP